MNAIIKDGWTRNDTDKLVRIFQLLLTKNVLNLNILCKYDIYIHILTNYITLLIVFKNKIILSTKAFVLH